MQRLALPVSLLVAACGTDPDPGTDCTLEARASVQVVVVNAAEEPVTDATVTYELDGEAHDCEGVGETWVCGWEVAGELLVRVEASGYAPFEQSVAVSDGECHVQTEQLEATLVAAGFSTERAYVHQIFEDQDECDRSWELYGMNCYQEAHFCADGTTEFIFTDIVNSGIYTVDGSVIEADYGDSGDVPAAVFDMSSDESELVDRTWGITWTLRDDWEFSLCR